MTTEDIVKTVEQEMGSAFAPHHRIYTGEPVDKPGFWVGDETLDYCVVRDVGVDAARKLVSQAYEEAAQEIRKHADKCDDGAGGQYARATLYGCADHLHAKALKV